VPSVSVDEVLRWALGHEPSRRDKQRPARISFCPSHPPFFLAQIAGQLLHVFGMLTSLGAARRDRHRCRSSCRWPGLWSTPRNRGPVVDPDPIEIPRRLRRIPSPGCPAPPQHKCRPQLSRRPGPGGGFPLRVLPPTRRCRPGLCFAPHKPDECTAPPDGCLALIPQVQRQEALVHTRRRPGIPTYRRKC